MKINFKKDQNLKQIETNTNESGATNPLQTRNLFAFSIHRQWCKATCCKAVNNFLDYITFPLKLKQRINTNREFFL